ncbi:MAG: protein kinase domain-containing protein [Planctomycetota bacterium]
MTDTLGPYELVRLIGKGGMGEVHLARDTKLDREVALKLLPRELAEDPERRARFLREARAAAALNHPNITTIHDVGEEGGRDYIAQEFLEGRPLNEILAERTLPLAELADIAVPLADALAYAHERGVIHRDLKPGNVIVTSRGHAKLLDFGLAKVLSGEDKGRPLEEQSTTLTISGAVFGTPSAMSPEQALGKPVDARADVFCFGSLLYEMAAGKPAFLGTTIQETLNKVLNSEPESLAKLRRDLPSEFVGIVAKALRKDPDERYQSMAELAADLRHFKRTTDSGVVPPAQAAPRPSSTRTALRLGGLVVVVVAVALLVHQFGGAGGRHADAGSSIRFSNPRQITSAVGWEDSPSWSGEGGLLAYHARAGSGGVGKIDIWVTQVGSGTPVNRTADVPGDCILPSLSPDGTTIVFSVLQDFETVPRIPFGVYTMPVIGGSARALLPGVWTWGQMQWSADSRRMACLHRTTDQHWAIRIRKASGETVRDVPVPDDIVPVRADLAWSRDERLFAYVVTADPQGSDVSRLWLLREEDGRATPLTDGRTLARSPSFSTDGRALYYVSNQFGTMDLYRQALDEDGTPVGDPEGLTAGLGIGRAAFSPDGRRIAYSRGGAVGNIWRVPVRHDGPVTWTDARQVTFDEAFIEFAELSPDGTRFAVTSDRAGNDDLWAIPAEGGEMRQLTTDPSPDWYGQWSPDGTRLLFYSFRSGNRDLWMMPADGGPARQLTDEPGTDWFGKWSPDGTRIAWPRLTEDGGSMWISAVEPWEPQLAIGPGVPADGRPFTVTTSGSIWADDESFVLTAGNEFALVSDEGELLRVYEGSGPVAPPVLVRGTRTILFGAEDQIHALDLDTGEQRQLSEFGGRPGRLGLVIAGDGEQIWFTWAEERGDLWVMDVEGGH